MQIKLKGKNILMGGPYKVGDLVVVENLAIKVDKVGWNLQCLKNRM